MKVFRFITVTFFLCVVVPVSVSAQDAAGQGQEAAVGRSQFYVVQLPIEKIFTYSKGYIIEYRKTALVSKKLYIPMEWFLLAKDTRKADILLTRSGPEWPHVSLYYKGNTVDHVKIYARRDQNHFTWGMVRPDSSWDKEFENITDLKVEFP